MQPWWAELVIWNSRTQDGRTGRRVTGRIAIRPGFHLAQCQNLTSTEISLGRLITLGRGGEWRSSEPEGRPQEDAETVSTRAQMGVLGHVRTPPQKPTFHSSSDMNGRQEGGGVRDCCFASKSSSFDAKSDFTLLIHTYVDYQSSWWISFIKNILGQHQEGGNLVTTISQLIFSLREFDDPCNFLLLDNCILLLKAFSHQNI